MPTQQQFASQMLDQLRALDPSISGEVGTPERKIIETVAQAMAEAQIDFSVTNAPFDVDAKYGSDIDKMISLFGYGRQLGSRAKGYITFSRSDNTIKDIIIPGGTQLMGPTPTNGGYNVMFITSSSVTMAAGTSSIVAPIECVTEGVSGNVGANTITNWVGTPVYGVTTVTNENATYGGLDPETDEELKLRFKNTVFRNVSGTPDQYLAAGMSIAGVTAANVVGPISRYRERIQVPSLSDQVSSQTSDINDVYRYTSSISSNKNIKHYYDNIQAFVALDDLVLSQLTSDVDFTINSPSKSLGDSNGTVSGIAPNITFTNVYIGPSASKPANSVSPSDVVHFEYSYVSTASRNNYDKKVLNCVDLFIDNQSLIQTNAAVPVPSAAFAFNSTSTSPLYNENYRRVDYNGSSFGQVINSAQRPAINNWFTPMFQQPAADLPTSITVSYNSTTYTYYKGIHYWAVQDVTEVSGSIRAKNGIEWSSITPGQSAGSNLYTGPVIGQTSSSITPTSIQVLNYSYDRNVQDLQAFIESNKQVTSDVLAHSGKIRYFKPDVSISYTNGASVSNTNNLIVNNLNYFLKTQPFGSYLQLSDIFQIIHNTPGVDNIDWTYNQLNLNSSPDTSDGPINYPVIQTSDGSFYVSKLYETDKYGNKLGTFVIEPYSNTGLKVYYSMPYNSPYLNTKTISNGKQTYNNSSFILKFTPGSSRTGIANTTLPNMISANLNNISQNLTLNSNGVDVGSNYIADILTSVLDPQYAEIIQGDPVFGPSWKVIQKKLDGTDQNTGTGILPGYQTPMIFSPLTTSPLFSTANENYGLFNSSGKLDFSSKLTVTSYIKSEYDHDGDVALGDNEVARLPEGVKDADGNLDISSVITIRQRPQNNWLR